MSVTVKGPEYHRKKVHFDSLKTGDFFVGESGVLYMKTSHGPDVCNAWQIGSTVPNLSFAAGSQVHPVDVALEWKYCSTS